MITELHIAVGAVCLVLGYIAGRVDLMTHRGVAQPVSPQGFFSKPTRAREEQSTSAAVAVGDIDTRMYVAAVSTDNLTKADTTQIGKTSVTADNINQSVSKLSQLKGK
jgi:hypothetical protein